MIKNNKLKTLLLLIIFSLINSVNIFADDSTSTTPEPYNVEEFPQSLKDLRRFEIITLGSMPFITIDATIAYSGYKYATGASTSFNPFSSSTYTQDEAIHLIVTSLGISAGIGLFDFVFNLVKRNISSKKTNKDNSSYLNVIPIAEDPDAIKIQIENDYEEPSEEETASETDNSLDQIEVLD